MSFTGWVHAGGRMDEPSGHAGEHTHPWYKVLWLTGVDYYSTLGYQPGIALLAAGALAPIATAILVAVTLLCAVPIYSQVALRSHAGLGSIALLENLLAGWRGRLFVLVLLGFAGTDFIITMTLSAADAAQHAVENPFLHPFLADARMAVTISLLALLAAVFLKGFNEAIGFASVVAVPYLLLNVVVLGRGLVEILQHPALLPQWRRALEMRGDWTGIAIAAALLFPRLALGLSGFETGVSVMPLIDGGPDGVRGRIRNTRKLLLAAALIMSVMLLFSSFVTALLIPPAEYQAGGAASGRAIAWLAHRLLGPGFGSIYDFSTILILWFAGASAMAGLLHVIPRYLPRLGMAPQWVAYARSLVLVLFVIDVVVTVIFRADVEAQGGAYATGVLVLMLSAAVAAALALHSEGARLLSAYCWMASAVFGYTLVDNVIERPDGLIIASVFIAGIITLSLVSRYRRAMELRVQSLTFRDRESAALWNSLGRKSVHLAPIRVMSNEACRRKLEVVASHYRMEGPIAFLHVNLLDNRSEFLAPLTIEVRREDGHLRIEVWQATAIANTIAYISELLDPISIFLELTRTNLVTQSLRYLLLGEGETGLLVYRILLRHWEETPEEDVRPLIYLMSD
ncbi:MAG: hypothetical protein NTY38_03465 [Acidobacteria bacterium]|nr:hypothetical protein [Acidobacteriota bacterium]